MTLASREALLGILKKYKNIFAWKPMGMVGSIGRY